MMKALKEAGAADNTVVIFASDNGPTKNVHAVPYRGTKYVSFEGGHRVPCIVHWPARIQPGRVSGVPVHAMDLFPTVSGIIGAAMPPDRIYDGESLLPLFEGKPLARRADQPFYFYNGENLQAVRHGDWKLHLPRSREQLPFWDRNLEFTKLSGPVLYNLRDDPAERTDVAGAHPELVRTLLESAAGARTELGEYMRRGSGQRATGSVVPGAPVISHEKDWDQVKPAMREAIQQERARRHPGFKVKKHRRKKS